MCALPSRDENQPQQQRRRSGHQSSQHHHHQPQQQQQQVVDGRKPAAPGDREFARDSSRSRGSDLPVDDRKLLLRKMITNVDAVLSAMNQLVRDTVELSSCGGGAESDEAIGAAGGAGGGGGGGGGDSLLRRSPGLRASTATARRPPDVGSRRESELGARRHDRVARGVVRLPEASRRRVQGRGAVPSPARQRVLGEESPRGDCRQPGRHDVTGRLLPGRCCDGLDRDADGRLQSGSARRGPGCHRELGGLPRGATAGETEHEIETSL